MGDPESVCASIGYTSRRSYEENSFKRMLYRIAVKDLRDNAQQAFLNALTIGFAVLILLTLAGADFKPLQHAYLLTLAFKLTLTAMLLLGLAVDLCFLTINRFSQVREKVRQYAVLRLVGASPRFFYLLQLQQTIFISVAGTLAGIMLTYMVRMLMAHLVPDLLSIEPLYDLWPFVGIAPGGAFFAAGVIATDSINGGFLKDSLLRKE